MPNLTIYIPTALTADLKRLRARLKKERSSLSRWFEDRVRDVENPRVTVTMKGQKPHAKVRF